MRHYLQSQVTHEAYSVCWPDTVPPYESFLDAVIDKLSVAAALPVTQLVGSAREGEHNRIQLSGELCDAEGKKWFDVELVWLPRLQSFRGHARLHEVIPPPVSDSAPEEFRHLLSYADRWGISCDVERGDYLDAQPIDDVLDFVDSYAPWAEEINRWLDTFDTRSEWPSEPMAFLYLNQAYSEAYFIAEEARTKE